MTDLGIIAIVILVVIIIFIALYAVMASTKNQIIYTIPPTQIPSPLSITTYVLVNGIALNNRKPIITLFKVTSIVLSIKDGPNNTFTIVKSTQSMSSTTLVTTNYLGEATVTFSLMQGQNYVFTISGPGITASGISIVIVNSFQ